MKLLEPSSLGKHAEFTRRRLAIGLSVNRLSQVVGLSPARIRAIEQGFGRPAGRSEIKRLDHAISVIEAAFVRLRLELAEEMRRKGIRPTSDDPDDGLGGDAA